MYKETEIMLHTYLIFLKFLRIQDPTDEDVVREIYRVCYEFLRYPDNLVLPGELIEHEPKAYYDINR